MPLTWLELALSACGTLALAYTLLPRRRGTPPPPPGPRRLPFIGNLLDVPAEKSWIKFAEWGDVYGDICSISILGQQTTILNSASAARDLLDKKSSIYSDRPFVVMAGELGGWKDALGLMPYGDRYRRLRRTAHSFFGSPKIMTSFHPLEEQEVHKFAKRLMEKPTDFAAHIDKTAGAIILRICHGYQVKEEGEDDFLALGSTAMRQFSQATSPGGFLVNAIPPLCHLPPWVPGTAFLALGKVFKETLHRMVDEPLEWVKEQIATGTAQPSILYHLLEGKKLTEEEEFEAKWLVGSLYAGGAHTTLATISAFFKAMVLYPEVMAKAQREIDSVVGDGRLPKLSDRNDLPYTSALVLEVYRWHAGGPTAVPHCLSEDDIHNGWFIPKGSIVIANIWKMTHDPRVYTDPMNFNPGRFIPCENKQPEMDPTDLVFGFGRRIYEGRYWTKVSRPWFLRLNHPDLARSRQISPDFTSSCQF
ncbi:cytochrome P450 [Roridomyces roridus]|uniref:Cytochrome P450 n=1 Tax=Roridomyces roridus TaxID=1738132 RepID=A0AAD7BZT1_9AGAR|nr:cytochrome P450 [Roridomyces roridus]